MCLAPPGFALPGNGVALEGGKEGCGKVSRVPARRRFISESSREPLGKLNSHHRGPTDVGRKSKNQLTTQSQQRLSFRVRLLRPVDVPRHLLETVPFSHPLATGFVSPRPMTGQESAQPHTT